MVGTLTIICSSQDLMTSFCQPDLQTPQKSSWNLTEDIDYTLFKQVVKSEGLTAGLSITLFFDNPRSNGDITLKIAGSWLRLCNTHIVDGLSISMFLVYFCL